MKAANNLIEQYPQPCHTLLYCLPLHCFYPLPLHTYLVIRPQLPLLPTTALNLDNEKENIKICL